MINRSKRTLRIIADQRRKISIGYKSENGYPKSANFFVTENPETKESYYPEITALYGANPDKLFIMFPTDEMKDFYKDGFNLYGSNSVKKRSCDGVECEHYLDETIEGVKYNAGECSGCVCDIHNLFESDKKELKTVACKCDIYLTAYILHPETLRPISPTCYMFVNHSKNSADNIYSELSRYNKFTGYPFVLSVKEIKKTSSKFSLLFLHPHITPNMLLDFNLNATQRLDEVLGSAEPLQLGEVTAGDVPADENTEDEAIHEADYEVEETAEDKTALSDLEFAKKKIEALVSEKEVRQTANKFCKEFPFSKKEKDEFIIFTSKHIEFINKAV